MRVSSFFIFCLFLFLLVNQNLFSEKSLSQGEMVKFSSAKEAIAAGESFLKRNEYRKAEMCFRKALELDSENSKAYTLLGVSLSSGEISPSIEEESYSCYKRAVDLNPKDHLAFNNIGSFFVSRGKLKDAEENYQKAIEIKPDEGAYYLCLATVYLAQNRLEDAENNLKKGLALDPDDFPGNKDLVELLFERKKYRDAIPYFKKMVKLGRQNPQLSDYISQAYKKLGNNRKEKLFHDLADESSNLNLDEIQNE